MDNVFLCVLRNKYAVESWSPKSGDSMCIIPFENILSHHGMFKACHKTSKCHKILRSAFFGPFIPQLGVMLNGPHLFREQLPKSSLEHLLTVGMDKGCIAYLFSLTESQCNKYQSLAVVCCLREMCGLDSFSRSVSMIIVLIGKKPTTAILIGALKHHSVVGHFFKDANQVTILGTIIRYNANPR